MGAGPGFWGRGFPARPGALARPGAQPGPAPGPRPPAPAPSPAPGFRRFFLCPTGAAMEKSTEVLLAKGRMILGRALIRQVSSSDRLDSTGFVPIRPPAWPWAPPSVGVQGSIRLGSVEFFCCVPRRGGKLFPNHQPRQSATVPISPATERQLDAPRADPSGPSSTSSAPAVPGPGSGRRQLDSAPSSSTSSAPTVPGPGSGRMKVDEEPDGRTGDEFSPVPVPVGAAIYIKETPLARCVRKGALSLPRPPGLAGLPGRGKPYFLAGGMGVSVGTRS